MARFPAGVAATALVAAAALFGGCRGGNMERQVPFQRDVGAPEDAGVFLVHDWFLAPVLDQQPPLATPLALSVDAERGRLLVLEAVPPEVRVYDLSSGRFVRRLGRQGGGPGEYRHPRAMATNAAGITAVLSLNGRLTFWGPDARLLGTAASATGMASDIVAAAGDTFIVKTDVFPPDDVSEFRYVTPDAASSEPFYTDDGLKGLDQPGLPFRNHAYPVGVTGDGHLLLVPPGPAYVVLQIDRDGGVVERSERPEVPPLRRSEAEIEELREAVSQGFAASGHAPPERIPIPPYASHVTRLDRSPDGRVWALTGRGDGSKAVIDLFGTDGAYLETYHLELAAVDLAVTRSTIYVLGRSAAGVPGVAAVARPDIKLQDVTE